MAKQRWLTCWVPHRLEMLVHPAWQKRPMVVGRILERLEMEHLRHGGLNNGQLLVSYVQFQEAGASKRVVHRALACAAALGLLEVIREGEARGDVRPPNAYRVTYLPCGKAAPSDEWKRVTAPQVDRIVSEFRASTSGRQSLNREEVAA